MNLSFGESVNPGLTTSQLRRRMNKLEGGHMNAPETTSKLSDLDHLIGPVRVNRVTLGLLLSMHLQASATTARTSASHRLARAITGLSSSARDYEFPGSTWKSQASAHATFQMWLTQCDMISGYLLGSGGDYRDARLYRQRILEILATSAGLTLIDEAACMTRRERARELTLWVLGDSRFSRDTELDTLWLTLWFAEQQLRLGYKLTSQTGFEIEDYSRRFRRLTQVGEILVQESLQQTRGASITCERRLRR
jgi:hypothetical protein